MITLCVCVAARVFALTLFTNFSNPTNFIMLFILFI